MKYYDIILFFLSTAGVFFLFDLFNDLRHKIGNKKRLLFWRVLISYLLIVVILKACTLINFVSDELVENVKLFLTFGLIGWVYTYGRKTFIKNDWMQSAGLGLKDSSYFDSIGFAVAIIQNKEIEMAGMRIKLLSWEGQQLKVSVEALEKVIFPWQFHYGIETFEILEGEMTMLDKVLVVGDIFTTAEFQSHRMLADKGAKMRSTLIFQKKHADQINKGLMMSGYKG